MLKSAYFHANFGFDTAEKEPCKVCEAREAREARDPRRHGLLAVGGQRGDERRARAPRKHLRAAHLLNTVYQVRQIRLALTIKFRKERDRSNILRETTGSHMRRKLLDHLACYQAGERRSTSSKAGMGAAPVPASQPARGQRGASVGFTSLPRRVHSSSLSLST